MFFIESNRLIKSVGDLKAFTTAQDCEITWENESGGILTVSVHVRGLINRRTIDDRTYRVDLKEVPGGYNAIKTTRVK